MVTNTDLYLRYEEADSYAQDPDIGPEYAQRFADIERKLGKLWWRDTAEWVAEFYREAYRAKQAGDREKPLCRCPNPRCQLKHGGVPYQLRRRETTLATPERTPMAELKAFLKTHPDAAIIDEALQHLRGVREAVSDDLVQFNRDARRELEEEHGEDFDSVPMAEGVTESPDLAKPPARGSN